MSNCRIIVADDHSVVREGVKSLINSQPGFEIVGEAKNGKEVLHILESLTVDLVVADISMPEMDGLTVLKEIKRKYPQIKVLILSMIKDYEHLEHARIHGASGYLSKDDAGDELIPAINAIINGKNYISPSMTNLLAERQLCSMDKGVYPSFEFLTKREKQVLELIARGMANKEISAELKISVNTVENHRAHLCDKLGLKTTAALVKCAIAKGLV